MSHSYVSVPVHYVFSTKDRVRTITPDFERELWAYLAGTAQGNNMFVHAVGGHQDHVHMLADLPATWATSDVMKLLKQASSRWMHETMPERRRFNWQPGYGAFGVGPSGIERTIRYIENQHEHHSIHTFQEEFLWFLEHYKIPYNPRYLWK